MRHVILTCKNHPNLRWSCKEIAFTDEGGYNGVRNIHFLGEPTGKGMYQDKSGLDCTRYPPDRSPIHECDCSPGFLVRAPEDHLVEI